MVHACGPVNGRQLILTCVMKTPRDWLALQTAIVLASLATAHAAETVKPAELVVRRANVLTVDTNQPRAQAFAVADGKFLAVGSDEAVRGFIGANTPVLDLA